jgi:hypothetical protein
MKGSFARIYTLLLNTALWFSSLHIIEGFINIFVLHISFRAQNYRQNIKYASNSKSKGDSAFHNSKKKNTVMFQQISPSWTC